MKKLHIAILAVAIICLIGGSYAVYLGNDTVNEPVTNTAPSINETTVNTSTTNMNSNSTEDIPVIEPKKLNDKSQAIITTATSFDFTDMYVQCPECGGFYALGKVTKELPKGATPAACDWDIKNIGFKGFEYKHIDNAVPYEYAYNYWLEHGDVTTEVPDDNCQFNETDLMPQYMADNNNEQSEKISIYDMNNPNQFYEPGTANPITQPSSNEKISIYDMNNPNQFYEPGTANPITQPSSNEKISIYDMNNPTMEPL